MDEPAQGPSKWFGSHLECLILTLPRANRPLNGAEANRKNIGLLVVEDLQALL